MISCCLTSSVSLYNITMKKIITIEVDISKHEKYTNDQINQFLEFEFNGCNAFECEDVYLDDVDIEYNVVDVFVNDKP